VTNLALARSSGSKCSTILLVRDQKTRCVEHDALCPARDEGFPELTRVHGKKEGAQD
jgi:hypothetical protein